MRKLCAECIVQDSGDLAQFVAYWGELGQNREVLVYQYPENHMIFAGEYEHRIDPQGRVAIPARFKMAFIDGIVLGRGYDNCLVIYTPEEWDRAGSEISQQPNTSASARKLARLTFSGAFVGTLDRSGRVVVPVQLREYAGLGEDVVIAGTGRFIEIWSAAAWAEERRILDTEATDIAEAAPHAVAPAEQTQIVVRQIEVETDE
jgi:MraZ protein